MSYQHMAGDRQLGRVYKLTGNAQSFHHLSPFALTIAPPRCGSYVERAFPPVFVLTRVDVWGPESTLCYIIQVQGKLSGLPSTITEEEKV